MAETSEARLVVPGGSWALLKRVIRAYSAVQDDDKPSVESVAHAAGLQRPVVSGCNQFLRAVGVLAQEENKLTEVGIKFATGLSIGNDHLTTEALQEVVEQTVSLRRYLTMLKARGSMKLDALRGQMILAAGLKEDSRNLQFIKAVLDMLEESRLIYIEGDDIRLAVGPNWTPSPERPQQENFGEGMVRPTNSEVLARTKPDPVTEDCNQIPFPLSPSRIVYVTLPGDWSSGRDLPKLLKLMELTLTEDPL